MRLSIALLAGVAVTVLSLMLLASPAEAAPPVPAAPEGFATEDTLSWVVAPSAGASSYRWFCGQGNGSGAVVPGSSSETVTQQPNHSHAATPGQEYYCRVAAEDATGVSAAGPRTFITPQLKTYRVELEWIAPTENEDGTPYTDPAGYRLYWGSAPELYTNSVAVMDPGAMTHTVAVPRGEHYFVATALNTLGVESDHSNVLSIAVGPPPLPPSNLDVAVVDFEGGPAYLVFTVRNQVLFVEAGRAEPGATCDGDQAVRGTLPDGRVATLNLVVVEDTILLPSLPADGEFAVFADCSVP